MRFDPAGNARPATAWLNWPLHQAAKRLDDAPVNILGGLQEPQCPTGYC